MKRMPKRTWQESNPVPDVAGSSPHDLNGQSGPRKLSASGSPGSVNLGRAQSIRRDSVETRPHPLQNPPVSAPPPVPQQVEISRKVKACAACRKQKIRCHMDQGTPPCRRCKERNLSCVLSKSLQMLMDERSQWHQDIIADLEMLHAGVQNMRDHSGLPSLPPLRSSLDRPGPDNLTSANHLEPHQEAEAGPSTDNSPKLLPQSPDVPMQSVYYLTKLKSLRGNDDGDGTQTSGSLEHHQHGHRLSSGPGAAQKPGTNAASLRDFISDGQITLADAQKLFELYVDRLDHFIYRIGYGSNCKWKTLDDLRRQSPLLTACILTVAAMHDSGSNRLYPICNREFRRLVSGSVFDSVFERRINRDHLRALCIASYWLSDVSWTLSGMAIRLATEVNLVANYHRVVAHGQNQTISPGRSGQPNLQRQGQTPDSQVSNINNTNNRTSNHDATNDGMLTDSAAAAAAQDAADCMRLWYNLYICDKHLSILYGRPSLVREDFSIQGWEDFLASPVATDDDRRLISQVALHIILTGVHELFGPDNGSAIPLVYSSQIASFSRQLDHWIGYWSTVLKKHFQAIGEFPAKGALIHYHFAKLYLFSHVFRGLTPGEPIPAVFRSAATGAVTAATTIVELLLNDPDIGEGLRGMPSYLHAMTAFACVFLLKIATRRREDGLVEVGLVSDLAGRLVGRFREVRVGKWHLVHLMADGLAKSAKKLLQTVDGGFHMRVDAAMVGDGSSDQTTLPPSAMYDGMQPPHPNSGFGDGTLDGSMNGGMVETPVMFNNVLSPDFVLGTTSFLDFNGAVGGLDFGYDHMNFP
ncbi:hypothetical protein MCOR02_010802 [Pyricularia oryzae]|uniref:Zn(2)-C6 fungal-type domain-containing protein n=1 Tax=Pyricularia grisea TaxID=148305 RepID=A0ABQ8NGK5_PYRGI|nr:hypothetical protein MCOR01_002021 [Pyricularia oryzae]KAI6296735.1 hypothetical protein MCOR33_006780 [Pyricularia grisea]KAH9429397.1 hypothetical protein MCOR02_010802 [Pyricularia oryzae]KAI6267442.1 hypothetical protein MCOR26_009714 [Pyricularia oryzae]KAI6322349.1 hypothetical protein MCOR29_004752 [Pyricularia oryzae]